MAEPTGLMDEKKGRMIELGAFALSVILNLLVVGYQTGKLEQRVSILEQLRTEARIEVSDKLADIKAQLAETNRKLDRALDRTLDKR